MASFQSQKGRIRWGDGWSPTGGPGTRSGEMAGSSTHIENFANIRSKSGAINEIPTIGVELDAQKEATQINADANIKIANINAEVARAQAAAQASFINQQAFLGLQRSQAQAAALRQQGAASRTSGLLRGGLSLLTAGLSLFSDERTKHTINKLESGLEILRKLKPVTFYYKEEYSSTPERKRYGFIAQEYKEHMPDATYEETTSGMLCIDTMELIALLVRANQELEARVARLEVSNALAGVGM